MFRKLLVLLFLLVPVVAFGQDQKLPKYSVVIWEAKYESLVVIEEDRGVTINADNPEIQNTLVLEFNTESFIFDLERGGMVTEVSSTHISVLRDGVMEGYPLMDFQGLTKLNIKLDGSAWYTIMVTETLDNGHVYNTCYKKVFDQNKGLWLWEVAYSARTR